LFTVDTLNEMVVAGMPFRDAYKAVAEQLENGTFNPQKKPNTHMKAVSTIYVWTRLKKNEMNTNTSSSSFCPK
jgi:argininosuccinate lyase